MDEALLAAYLTTDYLVCLDEATVNEATVERVHPARVALASAWVATAAESSVLDPRTAAAPAHPSSAALVHPWTAAAPAHPAPAALVHPWTAAAPARPASAALVHPWTAAAPAHPASAALVHPWTAWVRIRMEQLLPAPLQALTAGRSWGFITAWNPRSEYRPAELNCTAQHELLAALREWPDAVIRPGVGVGSNGWYEPSLFVIGPDTAMLDVLGRQHQQHAYLHGGHREVAQLRWLHD